MTRPKEMSTRALEAAIFATHRLLAKAYVLKAQRFACLAAAYRELAHEALVEVEASARRLAMELGIDDEVERELAIAESATWATLEARDERGAA